MNREELKNIINTAIPSGIKNSVSAADVRDSLLNMVDSALASEDLKQDSGYSSTAVMSQNAVTTALETKQDTLVSEVSIKTINGEDLLGSGDIEIVSETETDITPMGITGIGNITPSTVIPAGTTLDDFVRMLLVKLIDVVGIDPTASLTISPSTSTLYEVGHSHTPSGSVNYTDGRFTGAESTYSYNLVAGCPEGEATFFMNNTEIASFSPISLTNNGANQAFKANVAYGNSTANPVRNDGSPSSVEIQPGVITTSTLTYQARYRYFYGTLGDYNRDDFSNVTTEELKNLSETDTVTNNWLNVSGVTSISSGTYESGAGNGSVIIACPSNYELTKVNGGLGQDLLDSFTGLEIMNYDYNGVVTEYSLYILPIITASGTISLKDIQITKK